MYRAISSIVPDPQVLLSLEVDEVAAVLLMHLNSCSGGGSTTMQHGRVSQHNFFNDSLRKPEYPGHQEKIDRALMAAWAWLQSEGFLIKDHGAGADWFFVSPRGQEVTSKENFEAYRKANFLQKGQLHPLIADRVYPAFLRGEYDTAVFQAFREVEVAVRAAGKFPADLLGVALMPEAFKPTGKNAAGPLADTLLPVAEQEAMANLFAGAIGVYKNPQSHRHVPTDAVDATEVIGFACQLLRIVGRLSPNRAAGGP